MTPPRNSPCPCGSGKKYKKCHLLIERQADMLLRRDLEDARKYRQIKKAIQEGRIIPT